MFGFVVLSKKNASQEEQKTYKSHYCGLCHALNESYGKKGMMALSYDMVFLEMLLSDLYDQEKITGKETCHIHPFKAHDYTIAKASDYAADMQMLLYYFSLLDNVHDEGKDKKKAETYKENVKTLMAKYPRQGEAIQKGLEEIERREKENEKDPSLMSLLFGRILGEVFVPSDEDFFSSDLRALGCGLGRFIYLLDAWTDRKKDAKKGLYNPLPDNIKQEEIHAMLLDAASTASTAFERLPLDEYISILRNILYSGIWIRFKAEEKNE